jgi:Domain of unknown function (DUF6321)
MKITEILTEDWNKVNHHDHTNGLSQKAVNAYRREHPGSKLKTAVTTKPSKLKPGSKAAKRRRSFCARMSGNKGPMRKPNGKPTPKALALRRWHCESIEEMADMIARGEQMISEMKQRLDAKCWKGKHKEGTKIKGGVRVNNCVPNESVKEAANAAQQAAIAIAKKKKRYKTEGILPVGPVIAAVRMFNRQREAYELFTKKFPSQQAAEQWAQKYNAELHNISPAEPVTAKPVDLNPMVDQIKLVKKNTPENFADGRHPEDKGDSKRLGVPTHASVSTLRKLAHQGGRKGQLAHWMANMKAGREKKD